MSYDQSLVDRIRKLIGAEPGLVEKKMFGGLAFLVNGNMTIAASGQGGILVRVNPLQTDELLLSTKAEMMVMRGRNMPGWLRISTDDIVQDDELGRWAKRSVAYARTLPPKS